MNKIVIANDEITEALTDQTIKINNCKKSDFFKVKLITIDVLEDSKLIIESKNSKESKIEIVINIEDNVKFEIYELKECGIYKYHYNYNIGKNSDILVTKIHDVDEIKEQTTIKINGENSKIVHILKTVSKNNETYEFQTHHFGKNQVSEIINNGVNIKNGKLVFNVSSFVKNNITGCTLNQNNRIINLTNNLCQINPNLFIDENDVSANHSALIGTFSPDEMFYLMSRGITKNKAQNLLIRGFLLNEVTVFQKEASKIINKYWR